MTTHSRFPFNVEEHVLDCQHVREYPRATRGSGSGSQALKLAVKRYTPVSNPNPTAGDVTIIGAHGSGFPKELYEPLWEDVYSKLQSHGIRIRSIWIADTVNQGASGVLNEKALGNDPSWVDHARDLLHMINTFQAKMPQPIVGIGHSMGAGQLASLSLLHPRLCTSLILIEPVIGPDIYTGRGPEFAKMALAKRASWPSREEAEMHIHATYRKWDPRVLAKYLRFGLRDLPFAPPRSGSSSSKPYPAVTVALKTPPREEILQYLRPNFGNVKPSSGDSSHPDIVGPPHATAPFYRAEPVVLWGMLGHIRPAVLYIFGERSPLSEPGLKRDILERTGRDVGGSGGLKKRRVQEVVVPGGHLVPLEEVGRVAGVVASWLMGEMKRWNEEQERVKREWADTNEKDWLEDWEGPLRGALKASQEAKKAKL